MPTFTKRWLRLKWSERFDVAGASLRFKCALEAEQADAARPRARSASTAEIGPVPGKI